MRKTWLVYCDVCGREIVLEYPPRDAVYICGHCDITIDDVQGWC